MSLCDKHANAATLFQSSALWIKQAKYMDFSEIYPVHVNTTLRWVSGTPDLTHDGQLIWGTNLCYQSIVYCVQQ